MRVSLHPKQYFKDNNIQFEHAGLKPATKQSTKEEVPIRPFSTIPVDKMKSSLARHGANNFTNYLSILFGPEVASELIARYFIGTSKHWAGATVFWQIDTKGRIRTGKIMLYNPCTGKRIKEPYKHITWVHKVTGEAEYYLRQCLFGEHLLVKEPLKPVAIVESEKTAIIASAYFPQFIWLACGSLVNLNQRNCAVLKGRSVTLYPDLNGFEKWQKKANELSNIALFTVSNVLEKKASLDERSEGLDLADYLTRYSYRDFISKKEQVPISITTADVVQLPCETHTGKDFGNIIIVWVKTKDGRGYDLLFKANGEPVEVGEMQDEIQRLARFFEKQLMPIIFNGAPCRAIFYL